MYSSIYFKSLHHNEFLQFIKNVTVIVTEKDPETLNVKEQADNIKAVYTAMDNFYQPEVGNAITLDLQNLDSQRDHCLTGIEQTIRAYTHHYEDATKEAANLLMKSLYSYSPDIARLNYQKESNMVNMVVDKWKNESNYTDAVALLHLTNWVEKLGDINKQFETRFLDRLMGDAHQPEVKMIDYRKQATESYRELIKHLEAHATLSGDAIYTEVAQEINQLIEEYNKIIDSRTKKKEEETLGEE